MIRQIQSFIDIKALLCFYYYCKFCCQNFYLTWFKRNRSSSSPNAALWKTLAQVFIYIETVSKVGATPYTSVSVHMSAFRTRYFKLHLYKNVVSVI